MTALELNTKKTPVLHGCPVTPERPMVSVCVSAYQHEEFIEQCIQSILTQKTDFDYEILLGEDGSIDATRSICMRLSDEHPDKIRLFLHHRENVVEILGAKTGRYNFLHNLTHSRGKYIALCDGDDYWTDPLKLQKQVDILEKNPSIAVSAHSVKILEDGVLKEHKGKKPKGEWNSILDIAEGNFIPTPSCVFRSGTEYPDWILTTSAGDYPLHMLNAKRGAIHFSKDCMAVYRVHGGGLWSSLGEADMKMKSIHQLITLKPHFNSEVETVIDSSIKKLMAQVLKDTHDDRRVMDPSYLSSKFKAIDLVKALLLKFKK